MSGRAPLVAIVGRPNVGKSSLFNRVLGERRAIVEPTAGVTRDRLVQRARLPRFGLRFDLMDTGGIGIVDRTDLAASVEYQVTTGVHAADLLLFLVDAREGCVALDEEAARFLRRAGVPVLLCANKCETAAAQAALGDFARLGFGAPLPLSAQEGQGLEELYERMAGELPAARDAADEDEERLRVTVLGRRNAGKSSFVNRLLGEERVIVSERAGTTRDAVDVDCTWNGRPLTLVDTAGIHRRTRVASAVEFFSLTRSDRAIRRSDVALLFLDLTAPVARLDQELARTIRDRYKPVVVVGTKWDLRPDVGMRAFRETVDHRLPHLRGAPAVLASSHSGRGVDRVLARATDLREEALRRVGTGELNRALERAFGRLRFRGRGEKPRAFYATQLGVAPPTFLLFVNRKRLFTKEALRALTRELQGRLGFEHVPLRIVLRERERSPSKRG